MKSFALSGAGDWRRLLRPRWLAGHVLALTAIAVFIVAGLWQLDRLDQARRRNAMMAQRLAPAPVAASRLLRAESTAGGRRRVDPGAVVYRRVVASGSYLPQRRVLLSPRSLDGTPGSHLLVPLRLDNGVLLLVDRGWVPLNLGGADPFAVAPAPTGRVRVTGVLMAGEASVGGGADREVGANDSGRRVLTIDLERLARAGGTPLAPVFLNAERETPGPARPPQRAGLRAMSEGNHRSYAVQWFIFAMVVLGGYPLLLRRAAQGYEAVPVRG